MVRAAGARGLAVSKPQRPGLAQRALHGRARRPTDAALERWRRDARRPVCADRRRADTVVPLAARRRRPAAAGADFSRLVAGRAGLRGRRARAAAAPAARAERAAGDTGHPAGATLVRADRDPQRALVRRARRPNAGPGRCDRVQRPHRCRAGGRQRPDGRRAVDRRQRQDAAAGLVRHARPPVSRRRPAQPGGRRDHGARHGQRQRRTARAQGQVRRRNGTRAARGAARFHRGQEPVFVQLRNPRRLARRCETRDRLVCRARLPANQALQLDQARMGEATGRPCPCARPARGRSCAGIHACRAGGAGGLRRDQPRQPGDAEFLRQARGRHPHAAALHAGGRPGR